MSNVEQKIAELESRCIELTMTWPADLAEAQAGLEIKDDYLETMGTKARLARSSIDKFLAGSTATVDQNTATEESEK